MTRLELRVALQAAGCVPIPCNGKAPTLRNWQAMRDPDVEQMATWAGPSTGMLCRRNATFDLDITHEEAAEAAEEFVKNWLEDRGLVLTRFGNRPKRALVTRNETPFPKIVVRMVDPAGRNQKVEILCDGQQVIVDGVHPDTGNEYAWSGPAPWQVKREDLAEVTEADVRECTRHLVDMLVEHFDFRLDERAPAGNGTNGHADNISPRVDLDEQWAHLENAKTGEAANEAYCKIIPSMLRRGEHPGDVLEHVVDEAMRRAGNALGWNRQDEVIRVRARIMSGYRLIMEDYDPDWGVPPWLPGEFHARWMEVLDAGRRPQMHYTNRFGVKAQREGPATTAEQEEPEPAAAPEAPKKAQMLFLRPCLPLDEASLPPRQFLYGKHFQRGTVSLTAGSGGTGKSTLDMVEAIAMATGRNLLGEQPDEVLRVWYHNGEDPRHEVDRRRVAICKHYSIPQEELTDRLWTTVASEFPLKVARGYTSLEINETLMRRISEVMAEHQIDVAIFDPLVTLHSVSEIDTGKMDAVIWLFANVGAENDASVELAHHMRKPANGAASDYDVHDIRGVGAITDAVRAARVLNRMSDKDAENAGLDEAGRLKRFRVDRAKGNYSPAAAATWRQFVNIDLLNGDEVGVIAPWDFPGQGAETPERTAADQKADLVFLQVLGKFTSRGQRVTASIGNNYAPTQFAEEKEAKVAQVGKAQLKLAMKRLLDSGRIAAEQSGRSDRTTRYLALVKGR